MSHKNWKTIDVMGVIHLLGRDKTVLLKDMEDSECVLMFQTFSPYIRVRTATNDEQALFTSGGKCIIAEENGCGELKAVRCLTTDEAYSECEKITINNLCGNLKYKTNFNVADTAKFDYLKCLEGFDKGIELVCVESDGVYEGFFEEHGFKDVFNKCCIPKLNPLIYEKKEGLSVVEEKKEVARLLKDNFLGRIPVKAGNRIVGFYDAINNSREELELEFLDAQEVSELLKPFQRIMLTSDACNWGHIFEMCGEETEILVLNRENRHCIYDGSVDLVVCCSEPIGGLPVPCYSVEQIILDVLSSIAIKKAQREGAAFHVMYIPKKKQVPGWQYRVGGVSRERDFYVTYRDGNMAIKQKNCDNYTFVRYENGRYLYDDFKTDTMTLENGMRAVINAEHTGINGAGSLLYLIGYCPLLSAFSRDENSIASELQKILNREGKAYRVLQYACPPLNGSVPQLRSEINIYMNILKTRFNTGDIVCVVGLNCFTNILGVPSGVKLFYSSKAFLMDHRAKCFADNSLSHLTSEGNSLYAKWIYKEVLHDLFGKQEAVIK